MKAAPDEQERLLALQRVDHRLGQLARLEQRLPEREAAAALAAERDRVRGDLRGLRGTLEDAQIELRRTEGDVESVSKRIEADETRLRQATDPKVATGLEHELESLRRRRSDLEDVELAVMERVEEHEQALAALAAAVEDLEARLAEAERAVTAALAAIGTERAELGAQRAAIVAGLPAELVALYERQRARYGVGASLLRRRVSEASGVELTADELAEVEAAAPDDVLLCPSSNAILVRTAESGL